MIELKINYNSWFYQFHQYLTNSRNGIVDYNDTNWTNIHERLQRLIDINSTILVEQPRAVVGNDYGMERLLTLMEKSGYTFNDINDALIETYEHSLRQSMSKSLVNTRAVIYHTNDLSKMYSKGKYYLVDIPFDQLRFGTERDETIRQKFSSIHDSANERFLDIDEFTLSEYTKLLRCAFIVSINGMICNNVQVALNDHGLKFKIGYSGSNDAELIIYKLDDCKVFKQELSLGQLKMYCESDGYVDIPNMHFVDQQSDVKLAYWKNAIIDIYDKRFMNVNVIPNFGMITKSGRLTLKQIQTASITQMERNRMNTLTILVYVPKFFFEIRNVYPATNYLELTRKSPIYTDLGNDVKTFEEKRVVTTSRAKKMTNEICTPPICIDREFDLGFKLINDANAYANVMKSHTEDIRQFEKCLKNPDRYMKTYNQFVEEVRPILKRMYDDIIQYYVLYQNACMLTSLIDESDIRTFNEFIVALYEFAYTMEETEFNHNYKNHIVNQFYEVYYTRMIERCFHPFYEDKMFKTLNTIQHEFYDGNENSFKYNRPISEQCFISMKYSNDYKCWLFADVNIQPFHGIGNTFYVNTGLKGDEFFKFFVLYTDTFTDEPMIDDAYPEDVILDYDKFMNECDKHLGFIRYWNAENKLMKLSRILYDKYDDVTVVNTISKILKREINASDLMYQYDSELHYDAADVTTLNWKRYDETSKEAPFVLNMLFYALQLMNGDVDQLQSFFYRTLTSRKFNPRYVDYQLTDSMIDQYAYNVNFTAPNMANVHVDSSESSPLPHQFCMYYGLPFVFHDTQPVTITTQYLWVFTSLTDLNPKCPLIDGGELNDEYYLYPNMESNHITAYEEIGYAKLLIDYLRYLREYESYLCTNYRHAMDQRKFYEIVRENLHVKSEAIKAYYNALNDNAKTRMQSIHTQFLHVDTFFYTGFAELYNQTEQYIQNEQFYGGTTITKKKVRIQANWFTSTMKATYLNTGYQEQTLPRVRGLYLHFKKINSKLNLFQYHEWIDTSNYDADFLVKDLVNAISSYNTRNILPQYNEMYIRASNYRRVSDNVLQNAYTSFKNELDLLIESMDETELPAVEQWCGDVIEDKIKDLYVINDFQGFSFGADSVSEPCYILWRITRDRHFTNPLYPYDQSYNLTIVLTPIVEYDGAKYNVSGIRKPCEYAMFDGTPISNCSFEIYDINGTLIRTISDITVTFTKVSNTCNLLNDIEMLPNVGNTRLPFENKHESFEVDAHGNIRTKKHNETNYELYVSNKFTMVDKYSELVLQPRKKLQGSQDIVYLNNQQMNSLLLTDYGMIHSPRMFFKPCQVLHVEIDDITNEAVSIGGRYTEGQTIWMCPNDKPDYIFPCVITVVDHSQAKGFLEAVVDSRKCNWFEVADSTLRSEFFTQPMTCTILEDNLSNFLDEYNNGSYVNFYNPPFDVDLEFEDEDFPNMLSVPGDPLFVQNNVTYVYTRLNWFFPEEVKNRFMDESQKTLHIRYIGWGRINDIETDNVWINCINHDWSTLSVSEQYPILRSEPNDHSVWEREERTFKNIVVQLKIQRAQTNVYFENARRNYENADNDFDRDVYARKMADYQCKLDKLNAEIDRVNGYIDEPEHDTTWYNVASYDAAMKYIDNGRAWEVTSYIPYIRDIPYTDDTLILLYDWENKQWIDPGCYDVLTEIEDTSVIDRVDNYKTSDVLRFLQIQPKTDKFPVSKKILVYMAYNASDVFDDIENHTMECQVRFKPVLSIDKSNMDRNNLYKNARLRKHIDAYEEYDFVDTDYVEPDDFSIPAIHVKRHAHSGKYPYTSALRLVDITLRNGGNSYYHGHFDIYFKNPFVGSSTDVTVPHQQFSTYVNQSVTDLTPGEEITLICIENDNMKKFDTIISNITFNAKVDNHNNIVITNSSLPTNISGSFITTVAHNHRYQAFGGIVTVDVIIDDVDVLDAYKQWIKVEDNPHRLLPNDEFLLVPKFTFEPQSTFKVILSKSYVRDVPGTQMHEDNIGDQYPYEYYYDDQLLLRYPISTMRENKSPGSRLVIDPTLNENVKLARSNHLHVCRYFTPRIPVDGFIDVTGSVISPLSRDRYEFWVNGRQLSGDQIIILSPSSFQMIGLTSLKNFELIELVDDFGDTVLTQQSNVYTDINGIVYSSYEEALQHTIIDQHLQYTFNTYPIQHTSLQNYSKVFVPNPNNRDLEKDIMENIVRDQLVGVPSYTDLNNIPTINDTPIYYPTLDDLGMVEMDVKDLIPIYDKAFRSEIWYDVNFPMTHRDESMMKNKEYITLHANLNNDDVVVYATGTYHDYFMMYLSEKLDGRIDDDTYTKYVIPFVKTGVRIHLPNECRGLYLHATFDNYIPILLT